MIKNFLLYIGCLIFIIIGASITLSLNQKAGAWPNPGPAGLDPSCSAPGANLNYTGSPTLAGQEASPDCRISFFNRPINVGYFTGTTTTQFGNSPAGGRLPLQSDGSFPDYNEQLGGIPVNKWVFPKVPGCSPPNGSASCSSAAYAATFENTIWHYLTASTAGNAIGAAMIVDTMLGNQGTSFGNSAIGGVAEAGAQFSVWANLVNSYANSGKGLINWNLSQPYPTTHIDSTGLAFCGSGCGQNVDDEFFLYGSEMANQITFYNPSNPSQIIFSINRICGNIVGLPNSNGIPNPPVITLTAACDSTTGLITGKASSNDGSPVYVQAQAEDMRVPGANFVGIAAADQGGYWVVDQYGHIYAFGDAPYLSSTDTTPVNGTSEKIVGIAATGDGKGYTLLSDIGGIFNYGDSVFHGSGVHVGAASRFTAIAGTNTGYDIVDKTGQVYSFNTAHTGGSPVGYSGTFTSIVSNYSTGGYTIIDSAGQMYAYGGPGGTDPSLNNSPFYAAATDGKNGTGLWQIDQDGQVYAQSSAPAPGSDLNGVSNIISATGNTSTTSPGFWALGSDGGVFSFENAGFYGGMVPWTLNATPYPTNGPGWNYSINVSNYLSSTTNTVINVIATDGLANSVTKQITCGKQTGITGTCSLTASVNPAAEGIPFTLNLSYLYNLNFGNPSLPPGVDAYYSISGIPGNVDFGSSTSASGANPQTYSHSTTINNVGNYTITATITVPGNPTVTCTTPQSEQVVAEPYVSVLGGDTLVGSGGPSCNLTDPETTQAGILAFDTGANSPGSGDDLSAISPNVVNGFDTATGIDPYSGGSYVNNLSTSLDSLTFANSGLPMANKTYGGMFGTSSMHGCPQDYYGSSIRTTDFAVPVAPSGNTLNLASPDAGACNNSVPGNPTTEFCYIKPAGANLYVNIDESPSTGIGGQIVVFVAGNAVINSDIKINTSGWTDTTIPSIYVIVNGNIYVNSNVDTLSGVYVADPTGNAGGNFITCSNNSLAYQTSLLANCNSTLHVYGSVIANSIRLSRVSGSVGVGTAAETFQYDPNIWIENPFGTTLAPNTAVYQSVTALPPVL